MQMTQKENGSDRSEIVRFQLLELVDFRFNVAAKNGPVTFPDFWLGFHIFTSFGDFVQSTRRTQASVEEFAYEIDTAIATQRTYWADIDFGKTDFDPDPADPGYGQFDY
jgi:hypothetical protein